MPIPVRRRTVVRRAVCGHTVRRRVQRLLVVGLVTAASWAALTPVAALAAPRSRVTFLGGTPSGLLGCSAHPDVTRLRVPAQSTVTVLNRLGQRAQLVVNSVDYGPIPTGQQRDVIVLQGPVRLTLVPGCQLTDRTQPVLIEVTGVPVGVPADSATPSTADPATVVPAVVEVGAAGQIPAAPHFSGLLFLIATTMVVGVSIMTIRGKTGNRPATIRSTGPVSPRHRRATDKFR